MKTMSAKGSELKETWYLIDAKDKVLGRLASRIAHLVRGKQLANFTPHCDMRVFVVVINADKIKLTGKKWKEKVYHYHTGHPTGLRSRTAEQVYEKSPTLLLRFALKGMLSKNRLGRKLLRHIHIYAGDKHPHRAQDPQAIDL